MSLYEGLLAVHLLAAVIWVGGGFTLQIFGTRIRNAGDPAGMAVFGSNAEWVGKSIFMPASIISLLSGIWLVLELDYGFEHFWIVFGLAGIFFSAIVGATFLGPESGKVGALMEARGTDDPEVKERLAKLVLISRIELAILLLVVLDMAIKPGA